jgi:hypothetical protein
LPVSIAVTIVPSDDRTVQQVLQDADERNDLRGRALLDGNAAQEVPAGDDPAEDTQDAGPVVEAPRETGKGIEMALDKGRRGLPGGLTLARSRQDVLVTTRQR